MSHILLVDLGSVFWPVWMASKSQFDAYVHTIDTIMERAEHYNHVIVCADSPRNWRNERTADLDKEKRYKANRPPKAPEATITLLDTKARLSALGLPVVECDGYEADDVIASLATQSEGHTHVLSDDKDLYQLITDDVWQLTRSGVMTADACERKFGVSPSQMRDLLAIAGDSADNVEGCPGVGIGKGAALLREFGSIDGIRAAGEVAVGRVKGIGPKIVTAFFAWDSSLAVELVSLRRDCAVDLTSLLPRDAA